MHRPNREKQFQRVSAGNLVVVRDRYLITYRALTSGAFTNFLWADQPSKPIRAPTARKRGRMGRSCTSKSVLIDYSIILQDLNYERREEARVPGP